MKSKEERPVFIDLRTDFGFKRCFGDERVMKRFLNIIIGKEYGHIERLVFENVECVKPRENQRGVTFDLRCTLDNGDDVIVESRLPNKKWRKSLTLETSATLKSYWLFYYIISGNNHISYNGKLRRPSSFQ